MTALRVLEAARARGIMIATAESCTGGLISGALTDVPGSSDVVDRGFVTYSNAAKTEMLGVNPALIATHGAVSEDVARAMAEGALSKSDAGRSVAVTGVAGPGGTTAKPEGMVWFAVSGTDIPTRSEVRTFGAIGRDQVRQRTVDHALALLLESLM